MFSYIIGKHLFDMCLFYMIILHTGGDDMGSKKDTQEFAMKMIGFAGDAFSYYFQALDEAKNHNYTECDNMLKSGDDSLNQAHVLQTELITKEVNGEENEYSILMVHAQDHLMNAVLTKKLVIELIDINKKLEKG